MSDLKYRSNRHLANTISYEKRRMNTAKLRIEWSEKELTRREKEGIFIPDPQEKEKQ